MAIISLNIGNLYLEVSNLKKRLARGENEKAILHEELDKEIDFQKRYKHNVEIWKKNMEKIKQKIKVLIMKL
jgi:hypothetical protein